MDIANHPDLADRLAAAYALGTLRGGARRRFEAIGRQSPAVKARVVIWQERMACLTELEPARTPDPLVWERIDKQLRAQPTAAPAAEDSVPAAGLRRLAGLWRMAALGGAVAAIGAAAVALQLQRDAGERGEQLARVSAERDTLARQQASGRIEYVAVLTDERQAHTVLVTVDTRSQTLTLKHESPIATTSAQSLQLWALPPGGAPRSLGVLQDGNVVRINAPADQVRGIPALAISLEPRGGAPAGSGPTGPVVVKGALLQAPTI